jgi:gluconate 5-dehydrogenase
MGKDLFDLKGRVSVITGASAGLGVIFAEALAEAGSDLAICARRQNMLEETAARVRSLGRRCLAIQADVTRRDEVEGFFCRTLQEYGKVDILVNNAGVTLADAKLADNVDWDVHRRIMEGNLTSASLCSYIIGREMLARGYGRIINLTSILGVVGGIPQGPSYSYSIAKHGVVGLTRACALQWARRGITVNAIAPGYFPGQMEEVALNPSGDEIAYRTPMGRRGRPEELKTALLFLAAEASSYITGQVIMVDGGWTVW